MSLRLREYRSRSAARTQAESNLTNGLGKGSNTAQEKIPLMNGERGAKADKFLIWKINTEIRKKLVEFRSQWRVLELVESLAWEGSLTMVDVST